MSHGCHGIVHVHTFAHTLHLNDVICHVVRCVIPFPQRIWFKGEVGGFALFNFTENCPARPSSSTPNFPYGGGGKI